jgi:hypothetical protein
MRKGGHRGPRSTADGCDRSRMQKRSPRHKSSRSGRGRGPVAEGAEGGNGEKETFFERGLDKEAIARETTTRD